MPDFKLTDERAELVKKTQVPARSLAEGAVPQLGLIAVAGLHRALPSLRRLHATDPLGGETVSAPVVAELRSRGGRGSPLQADLSGPLEQHFGMDLSAVRVHTDPGAGQIARALQATAFTHGNDIYFAPDAFQPGSDKGQRVLAHEMSHIVAQRTGTDTGGHGALTVGRADDPAETAADRSADRAMAALRRTHTLAAPVIRAGAPTVPDDIEPGTETVGRQVIARTIVPALRRDKTLSDSDSKVDSDSDSDAGADVESVIRAILESKLLDESAFINKSKGEIEAGFDLWFGVRKGNAADVDVTKKKQAAGEVYGGFGVAVTGRAAYGSAEHDLPFGLTMKQYQALVQASAIIGVTGVAKGQLRAKLGKKAYTGLTGAISGFAGARASAQGSGKITMLKGCPYPVGAALTGSASAFAGVQSDGNATFTLAMNPAEWAGIGAVIGAEYDAKAGAWADAEGEFIMDPLHGLVISGSASAFAGVSAEVDVSGSAKLYGRKAFTVSTSVSGSAGVGGSASGGFSLKGGKLTLKGKAEAAMGPGMGGGFGLDADFKPFAVLINREIAKASWKALAVTDSGVGKKATDPALAGPSLETDVRPGLVKYRDWKLSQLKANLATEYVKMEKIQAIIDESWPRTLIKVKNDVIDKYLAIMLENIFGAEVPLDETKNVEAQAIVNKGLVKVLQFKPRDIASILGGTVGGRHGKGENTNAAYSPHGLAQG